MLQFLSKHLTIFFVLFFCTVTAFAKAPIRTVEGVASKVSDGDTIHLTDKLGTVLKIRFYGIDAPETQKGKKKPGQPYGDEAYKALADKIGGKNVRIDIIDIDRYKRMVSIVWLGSRNINKEMVAEGYAWAYKQYLDRAYASEFIDAETQARSQRLGLWRQNNPQPPWEFRKSLR